MANIKPKRNCVIQPGTNYSYNASTFLAEHQVPNFYIVESADELLSKVKPQDFGDFRFISFDTETFGSGLHANQLPPNVVRRWVGKGKGAAPQDFPFCISICDGVNSFILYDTLENKFQQLKYLSEIFEDKSIDKVAHNAKFDMHMLANIGMKIVGRIHDTVVLTKLTNENRTGFDLRELASLLPNGIIKFEFMVDAYKRTQHVKDYRMIPKDLMTMYSNADTWNCDKVFEKEFPLLELQGLSKLYDNEMQLTHALWVKERLGMKVNAAYEISLKQELQQVVDASEQDIYDDTGRIFNINSTKQLYEALIAKGVNRDWIKFTDKGNPTLDKKALEKLADVHDVEIVKKILEFRKNEKLLGTYAVGIYAQRDSADKVHSSINQTEATTGRMSITKPALQTLPKKDKRIRGAFIPSSDEFDLYFMDLDQIEYRGLAHYAIALGLIQAIKDGKDIHTATAALLDPNTPYEEITEEQRTKAKTVNFSFVYGQGDEASAAALKMTKAGARRFKELYFAQIPEVKPFIEQVHSVIRARGYVRNYYNRRRRLTHDEAYKSPNALIQGWAADYIKHKVVLIYRFLMAHKYLTRMINIVHDELIFEIHKSERFLIPKLRWLLSEFEEYRCPITAGVEHGDPDWGHKIKDEDIGFEPITEEEKKAIENYDIYDGEVFDYIRKCSS